MALKVSFTTTSLSLTNDLLTMLQIAASASHSFRFMGGWVSFGGTSPTAEPVPVHLFRQTDAGTGGTSVTGRKLDDRISGTVQSVGLRGIWSAEPTNGDLVFTWLVHPQSYFPIMLPPDWEICSAARLALVAEAPSGVDAVACMVINE